jgi:hypothetical protein
MNDMSTMSAGFHRLSPDDQHKALRDLARDGAGFHEIGRLTGLRPEYVARLLEPQTTREVRG